MVDQFDDGFPSGGENEDDGEEEKSLDGELRIGGCLVIRRHAEALQAIGDTDVILRNDLERRLFDEAIVGCLAGDGGCLVRPETLAVTR